MRLEAIVAIASNGVIGRGNALPWHLPNDLRRFREITMGHSLLMGRKTYDSIGRPLPGRRSFVLSRQVGLSIEGCTVVSDWSSIEGEKVFLIGGAELFQQLIEHCEVLHITHVLASAEGDVTMRPVDTEGYSLKEIQWCYEDEFATRYERWER